MDTKTAKPVSVEVLKNNEMLYCIECEAMFKAEHEHGYSGHVKVVKMLGGIEFLDFCYFPKGYEYSAPEVPPDGDWAAQDLDEDEKAQAELRETGEWLNV